MDIKHWLIIIEGVDKTCKDLLCDYIKYASNFRFTPYSRGILSLMSYNEKYARGFSYNVEDCITKNAVFVYLRSEWEDIKIRHKIAKEDYRSIMSDHIWFEKQLSLLKEKGYTIFEYNTSHMSLFDITNDILRKLEEMEENDKQTVS